MADAETPLRRVPNWLRRKMPTATALRPTAPPRRRFTVVSSAIHISSSRNEPGWVAAAVPGRRRGRPRPGLVEVRQRGPGDELGERDVDAEFGPHPAQQAHHLAGGAAQVDEVVVGVGLGHPEVSRQIRATVPARRVAGRGATPRGLGRGRRGRLWRPRPRPGWRPGTPGSSGPRVDDRVAVHGVPGRALRALPVVGQGQLGDGDHERGTWAAEACRRSVRRMSRSRPPSRPVPRRRTTSSTIRVRPGRAGHAARPPWRRRSRGGRGARCRSRSGRCGSR